MADTQGGVAKPDDIILARDCWIEAPDGDVSPLTLRFTRPVKQDDEFGQFVGTLHIECKHFTKVERLEGSDELHVLCLLLWIGRTRLELRERDGYSIWWREKGDLHWFDFWMGQQYQQEFCLPSAMTEARRETFYKANAGKTLMPSVSMAIEPDRPAVTIYRVQKDGSETLGAVIGPDEIKAQTVNGLTELIGNSIFWSSRDAIALLDKLKPVEQTGSDDHPTNARSRT
jgi:hypothetical protein